MSEQLKYARAVKLAKYRGLTLRRTDGNDKRLQWKTGSHIALVLTRPEKHCAWVISRGSDLDYMVQCIKQYILTEKES